MARRNFGPVLALLFASACSATSSPDPTSAMATSSPRAPEAGATGDTWTTYAEGFFTAYCDSCHDAQDTTGRDFTVRSNVTREKASIRCGVAVTQDPSWNCSAFPPAKQFPIGTGPKPSDTERERIVAWVTAGEP